MEENVNVLSAEAPETAQTPQMQELLQTDEAKQIVENLLFITDRPLKPSRIAEVIGTINAKRVLELITELTKEYEETGRSIRILEIGGGYQMCTKPEYGRWVRRLYNEKMTTRLSNAALETLAIIAYKQPVTRAEMEMIRGVDVAAPLDRLLERGLVRVLGKRDTIGRPMVYGTTDEFLRLFGLNKISELPDLQVFAAKQLQEKQEDLPFDEKLPPLQAPGILSLDADNSTAADVFFQRPKNMFEQTEENSSDADDVTEEPQSDLSPAQPAEEKNVSVSAEAETLPQEEISQEEKL
ncbi:SMC-Scp complex subunit ScpB [Candidatus Avelusimicrobium sp.]